MLKHEENKQKDEKIKKEKKIIIISRWRNEDYYIISSSCMVKNIIKYSISMHILLNNYQNRTLFLLYTLRIIIIKDR